MQINRYPVMNFAAAMLGKTWISGWSEVKAELAAAYLVCVTYRLQNGGKVKYMLRDILKNILQLVQLRNDWLTADGLSKLSFDKTEKALIKSCVLKCRAMQSLLSMHQ